MIGICWVLTMEHTCDRPKERKGARNTEKTWMDGDRHMVWMKDHMTRLESPREVLVGYE